MWGVGGWGVKKVQTEVNMEGVEILSQGLLVRQVVKASLNPVVWSVIVHFIYFILLYFIL